MPATVSYTEVRTFAECPMKWHFQRVLKLQEPWAEPLAFGIAVHRLIEQSNHGASLSPDEARGVALAALEAQAAKALAGTAPPPAELGALAAEAAELEAGWWAWPERERVIVEAEGFRATNLPQIGGVRLNMRLDALGRRGDAVVLVDYKTSSRRWSPLKAILEVQPEFYSLGLDVDLIARHEVLVRRGKKRPFQFQAFERRIGQVGRDAALRDIDGFVSRGPVPIRNRGQQCSWCGFLAPCAPGAAELLAEEEADA